MPTQTQQTAQSMETSSNPAWWTERHQTAWERVKDAIKRDWRKMKGAVGHPIGHEPDGVGASTASRGANGVRDLSVHLPSKSRSWKDAEPAVRFGGGARAYFAEDTEWDTDLDRRLAVEWTRFYPNRPWYQERDDARHGWEGMASADKV
ncbi:MAG: hypothetical protein ACHREM_07870 [Polyangiales bacterium]